MRRPQPALPPSPHFPVPAMSPMSRRGLTLVELRVANTLGDLTERENRFGRWAPRWDTFPFDAARWGQFRLRTLMFLEAQGRPPGWHGDGFDNDNSGLIDGDSERVTRPPYSAPLRGIQVKIRVYEPSSRQVREVTVVQQFVAR